MTHGIVYSGADTTSGRGMETSVTDQFNKRETGAKFEDRSPKIEKTDGLGL